MSCSSVSAQKYIDFQADPSSTDQVRDTATLFDHSSSTATIATFILKDGTCCAAGPFIGTDKSPGERVLFAARYADTNPSLNLGFLSIGACSKKSSVPGYIFNCSLHPRAPHQAGGLKKTKPFTQIKPHSYLTQRATSSDGGKTWIAQIFPKNGLKINSGTSEAPRWQACHTIVLEPIALDKKVRGEEMVSIEHPEFSLE